MSFCEGGEALGLVAMGSCGCPIPGHVQSQVGRNLSTLVQREVTIPKQGELEVDDLYSPFQTRPFCGTMVSATPRSLLVVVQYLG